LRSGARCAIDGPLVKDSAAKTPRLDQQICFDLYTASRLVVQAYRPLLDDLGLTYPQYLVMMVLWERDGMSVSQIGARVQLDSGTLTPLLKRLEDSGVITRRRSPNDDRTVQNWLTAAGQKLRAKAARVPGELVCRLDLSSTELGELKRVLDKLLAKLEEAGSSSAA
jgi:DNA-binding MarR family transcriptional regulator